MTLERDGRARDTRAGDTRAVEGKSGFPHSVDTRVGTVEEFI